MGVVKLDITHELVPGKTWAEIRFDDGLTVQELISKVSRHTGSNEAFVRIELHSDGPPPVRIPMGNPASRLMDYQLEPGMRIHVFDHEPNSMVAQLNGVTGTEVPGVKFELSDEEYLRRSGNAREFLSKLKQQRPDLFANESRQQPDLPDNYPTLEEARQKFVIGGRCQVGDAISTRGRIGWVGKPSRALCQRLQLPPNEIMIAILLDEPQGNFDGREADGSLLVECDFARRGLMVPLSSGVIMGDYPELDPFELDEI